jgi:hypothetical protein
VLTTARNRRVGSRVREYLLVGCDAVGSTGIGSL